MALRGRMKGLVRLFLQGKSVPVTLPSYKHCHIRCLSEAKFACSVSQLSWCDFRLDPQL